MNATTAVDAEDDATGGTPRSRPKKGVQEGPAATLRIIAGFKLLEAALLIVVGLSVLGLLDKSWLHELVEWLDALSLREGRRLTSELAGKAVKLLGATSVRRLELIALGCFGYAAVFVVEATGLWLKKRWAEYLTIVVTASLLPFEVMELMHRATVAKGLTLLVNLLVLGYLIWNVVRKRGTAER